MKKFLFVVFLLFSTFSCMFSLEASYIVFPEKVRAGESITIKGNIASNEKLNIVIASQKNFSPEKSGPKEKIHLIKDGKIWNFKKNTTIPYLYYIITSEPSVYGDVVDKRFGGSFFFKGIYKTKMFKLKKWGKIPSNLRMELSPIENEEQWDLIRYSHEKPFGINTICKEKTCIGKVTIFSRCVTSDHKKYPYYWNKGTHISIDRNKGIFTAEFKTFSHTFPNTKFDIYVNRKKIGTYEVLPRGLWLPMGWRYVNPSLVILGAIIAGTFYSMIGASGGLLMAAFQIIFIGTAGPLGINGANVLKPSNLSLMVTAPSSALYRYWFKERRLALIVALYLAIGVFIGSFVIGPPLSAKYLNMRVYTPWLSLLVLIMVFRTLYELTPHAMEERKPIQRIVDKFNKEVKNAKKENRNKEMGHIESVKFSLTNYKFKFWEEEFSINPLLLMIIGTFIGIINAAFGIGSGFLLVPTLTTLGKLPMYVAVPISLFSSILGAAAGMIAYALLGYPPDMIIVSFIVIGGIIGGLLGSRLHGFFSEKQLKVTLAIVLFLIFLRFAGVEIWI